MQTLDYDSPSGGQASECLAHLNASQLPPIREPCSSTAIPAVLILTGRFVGSGYRTPRQHACKLQTVPMLGCLHGDQLIERKAAAWLADQDMHG